MSAPQPDQPVDRLNERLARVTGRQPAATGGSDNLASAIASLTERTAAAEERLSSALESVARWMQAPAAAAPAPAEPAAPPLTAGDLSGSADQRLAAIEDRLSRLAGSLDRRTAAPAEAQRRGTPAPRLRDAVAAIAERQKQLDDVLTTGNLAPAPVTPTEPAHFATIADLASIERQLQHLGSRMEHRPAARSPNVDVIERQIALLASRLEDALNPHEHPQIQRLRTEVGELAASLARLPSSDAIRGIEREVKELAGRIGELPKQQQEEKIVKAFERLVGDMHAALAGVASKATVETLTADVRALGERVEALGRRPQENATVERIERELMAVKSQVAALDPTPAIERLTRDMTAVREFVEGAEKRAAELAARRIEQETWQLKAMVDRLSGPEMLGGLASRIEAFDARLTSPVPPDPRIDSLAAETRELRSLVEARLPSETGPSFEERVTELAERIAANRIGALPPAVDHGPEIASLASSIEALTRRIDELAARPAAGEAVEAVKLEISRLADRISGTDLKLAEVGTLEASVVEILNTVTGLRSASMEAAEQAAARAVREAIETHRDAPDTAMAAIAKSVADLHVSADAAGRRTADSLEAVHDTLERMIERFATLEEEIAEIRTRASSAEGTFAAEAAEPAPEIEAASLAEAARTAALRAIEEARQEDQLAAADAPIEPGLGRPRRAPEPEAAPDVAAPVSERTAFIAAARRAIRSDGKTPEGTAAVAGPAPRPAAASPGMLRGIARRRRAILIGLAAALLVVGAVQAARVILKSARDTAPATIERSLPTEAAPEKTGSIEPLSRSTLAEADAAVAPIVRPERREPIGAAARVTVVTPAPAERSPADAAPIEATPADTAAAADAASPAAAAEPTTATADNRVFLSYVPSSGVILPKDEADTSRSLAKADPAVVAKAAVDAVEAAVASPLPKPMPKPAAAGAAPTAVKAVAVPAANDDLLPASIGGTLLRDKAAAGDAHAAYEVGTRFLDGTNVARNPAAAAIWLEKAARLGLAPAQYRLGSLYERGTGVAKDVAAARSWYEKAAAAGNGKAMHNLGVLYAEGAFGEPDAASAMDWFRRAAERGVRDSQYNLAVLATRGLGMKRDLGEAYKWFALAADQGDKDAATKRDQIGARLDTKALGFARAAVKAWAPIVTAPDVNEAVAPEGGWDEATRSAAAAKAL